MLKGRFQGFHLFWKAHVLVFERRRAEIQQMANRAALVAFEPKKGSIGEPKGTTVSVHNALVAGYDGMDRNLKKLMKERQTLARRAAMYTPLHEPPTYLDRIRYNAAPAALRPFLQPAAPIITVTNEDQLGYSVGTRRATSSASRAHVDPYGGSSSHCTSVSSSYQSTVPSFAKDVGILAEMRAVTAGSHDEGRSTSSAALNARRHVLKRSRSKPARTGDLLKNNRAHVAQRISDTESVTPPQFAFQQTRIRSTAIPASR